MKKFFFLTATAAVMFASCAKVEKDPAPAREIDFQTANYLTKATTGAVYGTDNTFGTYSFTDDGKDIIGNKTKTNQTNNKTNKLFHLKFPFKLFTNWVSITSPTIRYWQCISITLTPSFTL